MPPVALYDTRPGNEVVLFYGSSGTHVAKAFVGYCEVGCIMIPGRTNIYNA